MFPHRVVRKHRDYCGDITNHYDVEEVTYDIDYDQQVAYVTITVKFVNSEEVAYEYYEEIEFEEDFDKLSEGEIRALVEAQISKR